MPIKYQPNFVINSKITQALMRIEGVKQEIRNLPITPSVLASLRETARLQSSHYSTMIEGNKLTQDEVTQVVTKSEHFPGRKRDEQEVKGYYSALNQLETYVARKRSLTEQMIQSFHALAMGGGKTSVKPTPYRKGQNVIRDSVSGEIVYLPPEAKDVPHLMKELILWINKNEENWPSPIIAGVAHYQYVTIHPYYDGNGRTTRLMTTYLLQLGGYDLKGIYSLDEYYAKDLPSYYEALQAGTSHNYYEGRADAEITKWLEYFCLGMADSFEKVRNQARRVATSGVQDQSDLLRQLDPKQRRALELFQKYETVTSKQLGIIFGFKARTASELTKKWCEIGFLAMVDPSRKSRRYQLSKKFKKLGQM